MIVGKLVKHFSGHCLAKSTRSYQNVPGAKTQVSKIALAQKAKLRKFRNLSTPCFRFVLGVLQDFILGEKALEKTLNNLTTFPGG